MTTRVIALDLDGTLLTPKKTLLPSSIEALARAREAGYQLIIVTGRHHVAIGQLIAGWFLAMPHAPYSSIIGIPLVEPVIRRTLGIIRRKDAVLSPAAERFFALLINLWTDDKDNLWTNIVERQRHALQEIG